MNKTSFVKVTTGIVALLALKSNVTATPEKPYKEEKQKPNIIVIMTDEHSIKTVGCYGSKFIKTPNIDKIGSQGVTFLNCYTNSPLCVPSRSSFLSGRYTTQVSVWNNTCWLPTEDYPTISQLLKDAGYESILCGKMHLDATRRHGFTEIGGNMNNGFMTGKGKRSTIDITKPVPGLSERFTVIKTSDNSTVLAHDRKVTEATIEFLKSDKPKDKPLFMIVGYLAPHFPLVVPEKYWLNYKDKIPLPNIPEGYLEKLPLNYKHLRLNFNMEEVPVEYVKKGREVYYGLTEWVDEEIGKVLDALKTSKYADNTVVIFTADHSENMGEHGMWWKNNVFDSATRIPLIISYPDRWKGGQRRGGVCSLVDVTKTIADLAGVEPPANWDGDTLVSLLDNPEHKWKDMAISEYYAHLIASGYTMIRKGKYKYVFHNAPDEKSSIEQELYDLDSDPEELNNLASDKKYKDLMSQMYQEIVKEVGEKPEVTEQRCRQEISNGYGRIKTKPKEAVEKAEE